MSGRLKRFWMRRNRNQSAPRTSRAGVVLLMSLRRRGRLGANRLCWPHAGGRSSAGRGPSGKFRATELFRAVSKLVHDRDAPTYQVIVNAALGESAEAFVAAIGEAADAAELRHRLEQVLSSARASQAEATLHSLPDRDLDRMRYVEVVIGRREDEEIHKVLRARLRRYRNAHRAGLENESARLMTGYLISEIFRGAADADRARFTIAEFRSIAVGGWRDAEVCSRVPGLGSGYRNSSRLPDDRADRIMSRSTAAVVAGGQWSLPSRPNNTLTRWCGRVERLAGRLAWYLSMVSDSRVRGRGVR
jgi:hypothetical protein